MCTIRFMKKFAIGCTHFGHKNCIKFDNRPFSSIKNHDDALVKNWNSVVGVNDEVYHLGDIFYATTKENTLDILDRLNGKIHLIRGNHDQETLKRAKNKFESIQDYIRIKHKGSEICMFHYPILEWDKCHRGLIHLHSHVHQNLQKKEKEFYKYRVFDMGCMGWDYTPVNLDEIVRLASHKKIKTHG